MTHPIPVPVISDEPFVSVLRILQLRPHTSHADSFIAQSLPQVRRVYGGQVIAQALLAAAATLNDPTRMPHSLHAYFMRGGTPEIPFELHAERLRDGRSFSSRRVTCSQEGAELLALMASFQVPEVSFDYQGAAPTVPGPESLESALAIFRTMDHPVGRFLGKTTAFDVRHVQENLYMQADESRASRQQLWMRPRATLPDATSQHIHRALLAYVVDQVMFEPAMRRLGLSWMTPGMSAASLDHAMWFHRDVDINDWLLYDGECLNVNGGRCLSRVRIFTRDGMLIAEAEQQGMLRVPDGEHQGSHRWGFGVEALTNQP